MIRRRKDSRMVGFKPTTLRLVLLKSWVPLTIHIQTIPSEIGSETPQANLGGNYFKFWKKKSMWNFWRNPSSNL